VSLQSSNNNKIVSLQSSNNNKIVSLQSSNNNKIVSLQSPNNNKIVSLQSSKNNLNMDKIYSKLLHILYITQVTAKHVSTKICSHLQGVNTKIVFG
jgi:hypothetical protein